MLQADGMFGLTLPQELEQTFARQTSWMAKLHSMFKIKKITEVK